MSPRAAFAVRTLAVAGFVGILGSLLLKDAEWHLGFFLWIAAVIGGLFALAKAAPLCLPRGSAPFGVAALALAGFCAWRDAPGLVWANALGAFFALGLLTARSREGSVAIASVGEYLRGIVAAGVCAIADFFILAFGDVRWREVRGNGAFQRLRPVLTGALIALPLLLIFGALLSNADAVFASYVSWAMDWSGLDPAGHIVAATLATWYAASLYRRVLLAEEAISSKEFWTKSLAPPPVPIPMQAVGPGGQQISVPAISPPVLKRPKPPFSLGITEVSIVLGSLNAMFLAFVVIQLRYLFGGAAVVKSIAGLSYAEYARQGFFELVWVFALALPLLLWLGSVFRNGRPSDHFAFQALIGLSCGLIFAMMGSAVFRMLVYVEAYGLTELRLYTTAFMGWLGVSLLWFLATTLRGAPNRFAFGSIVAGFLVLTSLNALNPEALIARTNLDRLARGKSIDITYLTSLSADAYPEITSRLGILEPRQRFKVVESLRIKLRGERKDFRSWNIGLSGAHGALSLVETRGASKE